MIHGQGTNEVTATGAVREANTGRGRFDLLPYEALEAYAIWSELGAEKYGERNWEQGLSVKDCIIRLVRHALKAANGWTDEDHLAACMWNAAAAITMMKRRPDCNDHPWDVPGKEQGWQVNIKMSPADDYCPTNISNFDGVDDHCSINDFYTQQTTTGKEMINDAVKTILDMMRREQELRTETLERITGGRPEEVSCPKIPPVYTCPKCTKETYLTPETPRFKIRLESRGTWYEAFHCPTCNSPVRVKMAHMQMAVGDFVKGE